MVSIRMGCAFVLIPHDSIVEAVTSRLEASMKAVGLTVEDMKQRTLAAREQLFEAHYGSLAAENPDLPGLNKKAAPRSLRGAAFLQTTTKLNRSNGNCRQKNYSYPDSSKSSQVPFRENCSR